MIKRIVFYFSALLMLLSCSNYEAGVRKALRKAGANRPELEKVLIHYRDSGEDEKYEAACFLIRTMPGQYSLRGASLDRYYTELDSYYHRGNTDALQYYAFLDSLFSKLSFNNLKEEPDLKYIDSHYLIDRIDEAFTVRNPKWYDDMPFSEFCEYLLPYRVGTEELEDWFTDYHSIFGYALDSLSQDKEVSLYDFCLAVNKLFLEPHSGYTNYPYNKPSPRPSSLVHIIGGTCEDYLGLFSYIGRSYGIPVAQDYTPQWGNHSKSHTWCAIVIKDTTYHYAIGEPLYLAREKPFVYRMVKVYREMSTDQTESLPFRVKRGRVPSNLDNAKMIDVTDVYTDVTDVRITDLFPQNKSQYVYLSCFDDRTWVAVDGERRKGNSVTIKNMGYPCVFLPAYYRAGRLHPAEYPVLVAGPDSCKYLKPDCEHTETVHLTRKFMETRAWDFVDSLRGGHFELADNPYFREAMKLDIPEDVGYNYQTLKIPNGKKYRYVRYVPRERSRGNIAELEVYGSADKSQKIEGKVIGNYEFTDSLHMMSKIVDGNVLSYAMCNVSQEDPWVGLDLGKEEEIDRICYLPRSDDNFIREGEKYELCYWDKDGWVSLGFKIGSRETQELVYDNVPKNALLILHNHTKGKEERIFTYEDGKQVWW